MPPRAALAATALALPALVAAQAPAQQPTPATQPASDERLDRLERRLNQLE
jgi:hypothetical protein